MAGGSAVGMQRLDQLLTRCPQRAQRGQAVAVEIMRAATQDADRLIHALPPLADRRVRFGPRQRRRDDKTERKPHCENGGGADETW